MEYVGPVEAVDIAATNAGLSLTLQEVRALAQALVDMGAEF